MTHPRILVITTGGTIDAMYDPEVATPYHVPVPQSPRDTAVPEAMARMGIDTHCDFHRFSMKDSKDITDADMDALLTLVSKEGYDRVLFVTGTDRMAQLGQYIEARVAEQPEDSALRRSIFLFTGAMGPLRDAQGAFRDPKEKTIKNDGWYNLRRAVHDLERGLPFGAYLRMGDALYPASRVTKDVTVDTSGPTALVTESGFRALVHPQSRGPKITN